MNRTKDNWNKLSLVKLDEYPVCFACGRCGQTKLETTVDYANPIYRPTA